MEPLEVLWDALLSRQPELVRTAYASLDDASRREVLDHLKEMSTGEGWHPEQIASAVSALKALDGLDG